MPGYTFQELTDMIIMYGVAGRNARLASRLYALEYPLRRNPHPSTFRSVERRLREGGQFRRVGRPGRPRTVRTPELEEAVLAALAAEPGLSTRELGRRFNVDATIVWRITRDHRLHPFRFQKVQDLKAADYPRRVDFCEWYQRKSNRYPQFPALILFTDESSFNQTGTFNNQNQHHWEEENPHAMWRRGHQRRFSLNIWAGIVGDHLIGPHLLPERLTGPNYLEFLQDQLPTLLEEVPVATRRSMWFMHDGAPAHFARTVREHLDSQFTNKWIGRNGPMNWPARSPDLNPLDFFLWGYVKSLVYETPVHNEEELLARIEAAFDTVRNDPDMLAGTRRSMADRCRVCIERAGRQFEPYLP